MVNLFSTNETHNRQKRVKINFLALVKKFSILCILFLNSYYSECQSFVINGRINGLQQKTIYLFDYYGEKNTLIDSATVNDRNDFQLKLKPNQPVGLLKLKLTDDKSIDIVFNNENISFSTNLNYLTDSMNVFQSVENKLYYSYLNQRNKTHIKLEILNQVLSNYPEKDSFYLSAKNEFLALQLRHEISMQNIVNEQPLSFTARIIKMEKSPLVNPEIKPALRNDYMRRHFMDDVMFDDTLLIRSNVLSSRLIMYLSFYRNPQFSKDKQETEFIKAIDTILQKVRVNERVYEFAIDYLIKGFEKYGYDRLITHIALNSRFEEECVNPERREQLEKKIENLKRLAVGKTAPDFEMTCSNKQNTTLLDITSNYTLLLFWASWCPHCNLLMPELKDVYDKYKNKLTLIAISIDTDKEAYQDFLAKNPTKWIDCCDFMGWECKAVKDYDVFATPTMYLLDRDKKILSKPITINELKDALLEIGLN